MKSVMNHNFSQIPDVKMQRSVFNRDHGLKTTFDAGYLIPILVDEALPGDTVNCKMTAFARLATPILAPMDNMFLESFFFSIPCRLVWDNWQRFMGEVVDPGDSTDFNIPVMDKAEAPLSTTGDLEGSLSDYLGLPIKVVGNEYSCLWHRAYNLVYNEWFRPTWALDSLPYGLLADRDDGPDKGSDYEVKKRAKRHDYFTSCMPYAQAPNDTYPNGVTLPLGTSAEVRVPTSDLAYVFSVRASDNNYYGLEPTDPVTLKGGALSSTTVMYADLTNATAATINSIRQAFQIQRMLERDCRGGTRYVELIRSHFNVVTPSQGWRSEYLGGGSTPVNIHPVPQTSKSDGTDPWNQKGSLGSFGTVTASGHGFTKSFTEHCLILGIVNVRADLTYQQGMNRMFSRSTRWDFYWPTLANIGEQAVLNKEIYCDGSSADQDPFGYQERYAEYRYKPSQITGLFRSDATGTLENWHLSQDFAACPVLDDKDFIEENPPVDRVIAVTAQPHFIFDSYFNYKWVRPMPVYSVPGMMDHF